jgi:tRNA (cytidine/uridine-2'-O-)-methyltransferase
MRLALYEPDIPQNAGAMMRLAACFGVALDLIEPCGFVFGDARMRRAGMDYLGRLDLRRHASWADFATQRRGRLILLTTRGSQRHTEIAYRLDDVLLVGRESAGVPDQVHAAADLRVAIPMRPGLRSLNVGMAAAIVLGEALRQTNGYPVGEF